jgi:hypothetical protein
VRVERSTLPRWIIRLTSGLAAWALLVLVVLLEIWPPPKTTRGWMLLVVAGPPAYLVLDWVGARLFAPEIGTRISLARFSWARIAYATIVAVILLAPVVWWGLRRAT